MLDQSIAFIAGMIMGSFLTSLTYRLPRKIPLMNPMWSYCPGCNNTIPWEEQVPLFSYLFLGGKCGKCDTSIPLRYFGLELLTATAFLMASFSVTGTATSAYAGVFVTILIAIAVIDADFQIIPDQLVLGLLANFLYFHLVYFVTPLEYWIQLLIDVSISGGILLAIRVLAGMMLKSEALGLGDVKLGAVAGLYLGWELLAFSLFCASLLALLAIGAMKWRNGELTAKRIAFGPYLCLAFYLNYLYGDRLLYSYINLLT